MTAGLPQALIAHVAPSERAAVERWWRGLDEAQRRDVDAACDRARDDITRATTEDGSTLVELPLELRADFVDAEDARDDAMWRADWIEYLNAHAEIAFFLEGRRFHICRAHADARRVARAGRIPHDFACPLASASCPFTRALARRPGRAIVLSLEGRAPGQTARSWRVEPDAGSDTNTTR
jgi:hypothetical protein